MTDNIQIENNNLLRRKLECPVCLDILNEPRILTECGHSLCTNCIILIVSRKDFNEKMMIECPICLKISKFNEISCLKINYSLLDVIDSLENTDDKIINSCPEKSYIADFNPIIKQIPFNKTSSLPDLRNYGEFKTDVCEIDRSKNLNENSNIINDSESDSDDGYFNIGIFKNIFKSCDDKRKKSNE